jgi:hypothetical protein
MSKRRITRVSVDLTQAQRDAVDAMMEQFNAEVSAAAGVPIRLGVREFFHMLLKRHADATGKPWPEDYPSPGGWRGGPKESREGSPETE